MRLLWLTDPHLNFLGTTQIERFLNEISQQQPDGLLITGDIAEGHSVRDYLIRFALHLNLPIWYVLGNHDYYYSSVSAVRRMIVRLGEDYDLLRWLPVQGVVALTTHSALIGHEGWSDGGYGDYFNSPIVLNDYLLIQELANLSPRDRLVQMQQLANQGAEYLREMLHDAFADDFQTVYVATHSPPFPDACWHNGRTPGDDDPYLPHFACKAIGDVLLEVASAYPERQLIVLCGHTHGIGEVYRLPNLRVLTGEAEYTVTRIQQMFRVE
jgi:3',5'-cyclic-AMP phosphodiesterase